METNNHFLLLLHLFAAAALFTPSSFFLLLSRHLFSFFLFTHHFHLAFFPLCWPPPTRLQPTSCQRAERWAGRGRSELQSYTKFSGSLAEMWRAEKWNTGLTERVNLNYRKTLRRSFSVLHLWLLGIRSSSVSPSTLCLASQQLSFILFLSGWFKVSARERSSACDQHTADYAVFLSNLPGCL